MAKTLLEANALMGRFQAFPVKGQNAKGSYVMSIKFNFLTAE